MVGTGKPFSLCKNTEYLGALPEVLPPRFGGNNYHLDSTRTPEEILAERSGGYCVSKAVAGAVCRYTAKPRRARRP